MSAMTARCAVTIQPTLTAERLPVLADAIINKLWPCNQGGIVLLQRQRLVGMLEPLRQFIALTKTPQQFWVIREGIAYRFEPA